MTKNEIAPVLLKRAFDKLFDNYCSGLKKGIEVKLFVSDNENNRVLLEEFKKNYLRQRADHEGWTYVPGNFEVFYSNQISPLNNEVRLYNPHQENVGLEKLNGHKEVLFRKLEQGRADEIRDVLDLVRLNQ